METLCFGCMQSKECTPICEHCGYDDRTENLIHQLPVGTSLQNQYLIGRVLGQGGFGITYLGWDQLAAGPVAIKEYFPSGVVQRHPQHKTHVLLTSGEAPERFQKYSSRFLKEARTLAQLTDIPEIVHIRNFFSQNNTAYIVMEYVQGITLKEHLKKLGRPLTDAEALTIMEPVLLALQKVHDQGLIHRDISPDNIMLPDSGGIKLIDFGTVRYVDDSGKSKSTEAILKPGFAPIEQYNTKGKLGTWTDVYALCATFHYLLTGRVPPEVLERLDNGESLTLLRDTPGIPIPLIETLEQGMKVRSAERIQTVEDLYNKLYKNIPQSIPEFKPAPPVDPVSTHPEPPAAPNPLPKELPAPKKNFRESPVLKALCLAFIVSFAIFILAAMILTSIEELQDIQPYSTTDVNPIGSPRDAHFSKKGDVTVYGLNEQLLDNGNVRYTLDFSAPANLKTACFDPPDGSLFMLQLHPTTGNRQTIVFTVALDDVRNTNSITIKFYNDSSEHWVFFYPYHFL